MAIYKIPHSFSTSPIVLSHHINIHTTYTHTHIHLPNRSIRLMIVVVDRRIIIPRMMTISLTVTAICVVGHRWCTLIHPLCKKGVISQVRRGRWWRPCSTPSTTRTNEARGNARWMWRSRTCSARETVESGWVPLFVSVISISSDDLDLEI